MTSSSMSRTSSPARMRSLVRGWRGGGRRVAFVPTMGALHEGHLSLIRRARRRADRIAVSIFVNPRQFDRAEDLERYPRDLGRDLRLCRLEKVDACFTPAAGALYPPGHRTEVRVTGLESVWEGASRPGHFAGVTLVVLKLLHIVEPDLVLLGQKDAQQAVILERMIRDLDLPVRVLRAPVVREPDGLAMSSRNVRLTEVQRRAAPVLHRALVRARRAAREGERSPARLLKRIRREIEAEPAVRLDYAAVVDADTLEPLRRMEGRVLIPVAAFLGRVRLIDNVQFRLP